MEDQYQDDAHYMSMALKVAKAALAVGEVPVGCIVLLKDYPSIPEPVVISHGANQVNATRDATRHAEIVAIDRLLSGGTSSDHMRLDLDTGIEQDSEGTGFQFHHETRQKNWEDHSVNDADEPYKWKNMSGWRKKLNEEFKSPEVLKHCELYVTCEPCIMCGIKRVVFGCKNDRFGGCGSLLDFHTNEEPSGNASTILKSSVHPFPNSSPGYVTTTGVLENEAIALLRSFYDRENCFAPNEKRRRKL